MFDKEPEPREGASPSIKGRIGPDDERIALRCNRRELQLLDSFVASGEFASRSELMRDALHAFLRDRSRAGSPSARSAADPRALVEVAVRLRPDEVDALAAYSEIAANGQAIEDLLAQLVRRGEIELKIRETVERSRASVKAAGEVRQRIHELGESAEDLRRRGVVGR